MKSFKTFLQASLAFALVISATQLSAMYSTKAQIEQRTRTVNKLWTQRENLMSNLQNTYNKADRAMLMEKLNNINDQIEMNQKELASLKNQL
ncbi:MAG TPA: hypothetical protein VKU36_00810 [Candidatus Babeliales bacterium]|nr:hypothetical protein [Candidatus Babeliales bacterium]